MYLYNLGKASWEKSQLIYHALAYLGREALVLISPATPYVSIGYHQDAAHEVDLDFCRANDIPVFRREVGGGAVYLDGDQLFFHLILKENNPAIPASKRAFYKKFLRPVINVYRRIGIPAEFKPVNDVIVNDKKISGSGVGEIGECVVFVGNLIFDFNYKMMSRILRVPDEKFRDKVQKTIEENLTTIRRELGSEEGSRWNEHELNMMMAEEFGTLLGSFLPSEKDAGLRAKMEELGLRMINDGWLHQKGRAFSHRAVKIRDGVIVKHHMHKAPGGLIRADFEIFEGTLFRISISGDFFCYPEDGIVQLEKMLEGTATTEIQSVLSDFCGRQDIEIPGVELQDWIKVLEI